MKSKSKFASLIKSKRLLETFFKLLEIKSPSKNEGEIVQFVSNTLKKLGLKVIIDDSGKKIGSNGGNIIARKIKGTRKEITPIFLGAHLDTVNLNGDVIPVIQNGKITNKNKNCILGGDDKVAVAAIIEAMRVIKENSIKTGDIYLIFTIAEEIAILGAKYVDLKKVPAKYGFIFDGEGDIGVINNQAPFQNTLNIRITGKAAHAGIEPEKGLNSIKVASEAISRIRCGRIDKETTCNIGVINGGVAINIVPEITDIRAEARSLKVEKLDNITKEITDTFIMTSKKYRAKIELDVEREYDGFKIGEDELPVQIGKKSILEIGRKPAVVSTGGGSDINIFNAKGKKAISFSSGMENVHSKSEYVKFSELEKLVILILEIITSDLLGFKNQE